MDNQSLLAYRPIIKRIMDTPKNEKAFTILIFATVRILFS